MQVASSFLRECGKFGDHVYGVILGPGLTHVERVEEYPSNFSVYCLDYRPAQQILSFRGAGADLRMIESSFNPDVVFTVSGPSYWRPRAPHLMGFNLAHNLYPDSPYFTRILNPAQKLRWYMKSRLIRHFTKNFADAWVVQTDDVNERLRRWIGKEHVHTVSNTISAAYLLESSGTGRNAIGASTGLFRLLVLSSYYPHKNLEIVNDIIHLMRKRGVDGIRFVMTLPARDFENAIKPENRSWIENVGPQVPDKCPALYKEADALFLPTLLECFSANYVEAMAMGRPIITTDFGFSRTICSDAALYFEPLNAEEAFKRIIELRADEGLQRSLASRGELELRRFGTAYERAEKYLSLCQGLVDQRSRR